MSMKTFKKRGKQFIRFTDWAIKQGLIRHRGFSSHETVENIKTFIDTGEFSAMLLRATTGSTARWASASPTARSAAWGYPS